MGEALCVVCRRREPVSGHVCDVDRDRIADQLGGLLRLMTRLRTSLVPSPGPASDRVNTSRTGSPMPARLDVLSLIGPGNEAVTATLHPLIRHWSTTRTVDVTTVVGGKLTTIEREIVEWHREAARTADGREILVGSDQIGTLPPAEWLDSWVRAWRRHFNHSVPLRTRTELPPAPPRPDWRGTSDPALTGRRAGHRQARINLVLGLVYGYGGNLPAEERREDPLADEWEIRFGEPPRDTASADNVRYLLTWLDEACEQDVGIGALAGELRALTAELTRVLGELPDQQWLGRCPATVTDRDTGSSRPCGAGLWQDPHASQVQCPRCQSTWGPRKVELLHLATEIRRTWPVDRRRRYTLTEIEELRPLHCPTCGRDALIGWRDVTATTDTARWWRPERVHCPAGCPDAERLI